MPDKTPTVKIEEKKEFDDFALMQKILSLLLEDYQEVFNSPEKEDDTPEVTSEIWSISFLNQVKDAMEQRKLKVNPAPENKYAKIMDLITIALMEVSDG